MKKIISVLTAVLILAAFILPGTVLAAGDPTFAVSNVTAKAGSDAEVKISIKNNPGIASAKFQLTFDSDLTLTAVKYGTELGGMPQMPAGIDKGLASPVTLNWFNGAQNMAKDTDYATLTFKVSDSAASGDHKVEITYDEEDVFNLAEKNIKFKVENGAVNVTGGTATSSATTDKSVSETGDGVADGGDTTTIGAIDEDSGNYTGPEVLFDEDGNVIEEDEAETGEAVGTQQSNTGKYIIYCAAAVAVVLIIIALIVASKRKPAVTAKPEEEGKPEEDNKPEE